MPERSSISISGNDGFNVPVPVSPVYTIYDSVSMSTPMNTHWQFIVPPDGMVYSLVQFDVLSDELVWFISSLYVNGVQIFGDISGYPPKYCPGLGKTVKLRHPDIVDIYIYHVYNYNHDYYWSMDFWREPGGEGAYEVSPLSKFTVNTINGQKPLTVSFTNGSYGSNLTYDWDFGDGSDHSTEKDPSHTYTTAGSYYPSLTISNDLGEVTYILPLPIVVYSYIMLDDYVVVDPHDIIDVTNQTVSVGYMITDDQTRVYKNYGSNYFGDINISFKFFCSWCMSEGVFVCCMFSDSVVEPRAGSGNKLLVYAYGNNGSTYNLHLQSRNGTTENSDDYATLNVGTAYKFVLTRSLASHSAQLKIYSGANYDNLVDTLNISHTDLEESYGYHTVVSSWHRIKVWVDGVCYIGCYYIAGYVTECIMSDAS